MDKATLLSKVRESKAEWNAALAEVSREQRMLAELGGGWTAKDIVAHITWSEREMATLMRLRSMEGASPLWAKPWDERNNAIYQENRERPLHEVMTEAEETWRELLEGLEGLSDEDLVDPNRFAGMPADWVPWEIIAQNTYEHYTEHIPMLSPLKGG
jgi:hypothetical protein